MLGHGFVALLAGLVAVSGAAPVAVGPDTDGGGPAWSVAGSEVGGQAAGRSEPTVWRPRATRFVRAVPALLPAQARLPLRAGSVTRHHPDSSRPPVRCTQIGTARTSRGPPGQPQRD
jgi:hypothetical protein